MTQAIIFTGGINHPFDSAAPALAEVLQDAGLQPRISYEIAEVIAALQREPSALLVIYALRWSMTQHEKYLPDRPRWAFSMPLEARAAIANHVRSGGGLLGVHTASICFDDWPEWGEVLGSAWVWGQSYHPMLGPVKARLAKQHFLTRGLEDFAVNDEVYSNLQLAPGVEIGAWVEAAPGAKTASGDNVAPGAQPCLVSHRYGSGRAVYDSLGHDAASLQHPVHRRLLQRAALWACGKPEHIVEAA
jgi:type 1 glutamine amidotransferase